jgi:hypothetical protein
MTRRSAGFATMASGLAVILLAVLAYRFDVTWKLLLGLGILTFIAGFYLAF